MQDIVYLRMCIYNPLKRLDNDSYQFSLNILVTYQPIYFSSLSMYEIVFDIALKH